MRFNDRYMIANLRLSARILLTKRLLSSCVNHIPTNLSKTSEHESKIQSLNTNFHPQTLINLLSSTPDLIDSFTMHHHKFDEAFRVYGLLSCCNSYELGLINRLLRVLVERKSGIESVLFVYKEMVKAGVGPNTETLNCLMQALFDADRVDSVLDQYTRMRKKGCCPNSETYEIVVSGLIGKKFFDEGIVVVNDALESGCDLESGFFSRVLPSLVKMNRHEMCLRLFQKMKSLNVVVDLSVYEDYNIIMKSMSKGRNLLIIVGRMVVQGYPLNSETYNLLIKSMSENQRTTECALFLNRMVNEGLLPDTEVLFNALSFLSQRGQLHRVLPTIHKLLSVSDDAICNILINGLWKEGYMREARLVLDMMLEKGWVPDSTTHQLMINTGTSEVVADGKGDTRDEITNILSEGFGEL